MHFALAIKCIINTTAIHNMAKVFMSILIKIYSFLTSRGKKLSVSSCFYRHKMYHIQEKDNYHHNQCHAHYPGPNQPVRQ